MSHDTGTPESPIEHALAELYHQHTATGWEQLADGGHHYRHRGGVITADGFVPAERDLGPDPLEGYLLAQPTRDPQALAHAWAAGTGAQFDLLPPRVSAPLIGSSFAAILAPHPQMLVVVDPAQSVGPRLIAQTMHHFGAHWEWPLAGGGTLTDILATMRTRRDALIWVQDAPTDWAQATGILEGIATTVHALYSDQLITPQPHRPDLPGGPVITSSTRLRIRAGGLYVPVTNDQVEATALDQLNYAESRHGRALLLASFISWLAADLPHYRATYQHALTSGPAEPTRHAWMGWVALTDFLVDAGALTTDDRERVLSRVRSAFRETAHVDQTYRLTH